MARAASDRVILEVHLLNQEILRLDTMAKQRITAVRYALQKAILYFAFQSKRIRRTLFTRRNEGDQNVAGFTPRQNRLDIYFSSTGETIFRVKLLQMPSRSEQLKLNNEIERHTRELEENTKQMRKATVSAKKRICKLVHFCFISDFQPNMPVVVCSVEILSKDVVNRIKLRFKKTRRRSITLLFVGNLFSDHGKIVRSSSQNGTASSSQRTDNGQPGSFQYRFGSNTWRIRVSSWTYTGIFVSFFQVADRFRLETSCYPSMNVES